MTGEFAELLALPGVTETLELRAPFGLLAFHGGLEAGTHEIATEVAERAGASLYAVRQPEDLRWHIPSHRVASAALTRFAEHVEVAVAVHGYGRRARPRDLLLGGTNRELACALGGELRARLPGFTIVDDIEQIPAEMRGQHRSNPVNLPALGGVQLELPPLARAERGVVEAIVAVAQEWSSSKVPPDRQ